MLSVSSAQIINLGQSAQNSTNITYIDEQALRYYFACSRGFIDGFEKGLFNNNSEGVDEQCMGEETVQQVLTLEEIIIEGDVW